MALITGSGYTLFVCLINPCLWDQDHFVVHCVPSSWHRVVVGSLFIGWIDGWMSESLFFTFSQRSLIIRSMQLWNFSSHTFPHIAYRIFFTIHKAFYYLSPTYKLPNFQLILPPIPAPISVPPWNERVDILHYVLVFLKLNHILLFLHHPGMFFFFFNHQNPVLFQGLA